MALMLGTAMLCAAMPCLALTGAEELQRRQQDFDSGRRARDLNDLYQPGEPMLPSSSMPAETGGPCFQVDRLALENVGTLLSAREQQAAREEHEGRCLGLAEIRALQATLTRLLVERGYVTSRVLLPEQDISSGVLRLTFVPGRIEGYDGALPPRGFAAAFPGRAEDLLRLPALEQGVENLNRLPGMNATLDIVPGATSGGSRVRIDDIEGRHWMVQATLDAGTLEDEEETYGRASLVIGNLFGMADRISLGGGTALDQHRLDASQDVSAEIDIPRGFWRATLGYHRQQYRDDVAGVLTTFRTDGDSSNTRLELARVLHRHGNTRWAIAALAGEDVAENRVNDTVIEVSSQTVRTLGVRVEASAVAAGTSWTAWLTVDEGDASGPATQPLGMPSVADTRAERAQAYLRALRPWQNRRTAWTTTLNAQFSKDDPFPAQRMSLTADSMVRGFADTSVSAANVLAFRSEWSHVLASTESRLPGQWQPYLGFDAGWAPNDAQADRLVRAMSWTAGLLWSAPRWQGRLEASDPLGGPSTIDPVSTTLSATLAWSY